MSNTDILRIPDYFGHIVEAIKRIHRYAEDRSEVGFFTMGTHLAEYALFTSTPTNHYPHPPEPCRKLRPS